MVSSSISFFKDIKFLSYRSFTSLIRVTPRYFLQLVAIMEDDASLISFKATFYYGGEVKAGTQASSPIISMNGTSFCFACPP